MADNKNREQIVSPRGVAVFPRLNKPDTKFKAEGEYSVKLKLDTSNEKVQAFLAKIEATREAALPWAAEVLEERLASAKDAAKKGAVKAKIKSLKSADSPVKPVLDEDGNETNFVQINFKCAAQFKDKKTEKIVKVRPALKDYKLNVIDPARCPVGGGSEIQVSALMYPYFNEKDNVAGVAFRLQAVKILKLVKWTGGNDGFTADDEEGEDLDLDDAPSGDSGAGDEDSEDNPDF